MKLHKLIAIFSILTILISGAMPNAVLAEESPQAFNLLLIGYDSYKPDGLGRSDCMMLAQITPERGDIKLVSFLRDMYLPIPGHGSSRLNAAYYFGGAGLLKKTLSQSFGVRIDRSAAMNFTEMTELVDAIGGVEVEVSESERKQLNSILKYYNKSIGLSENDGLLAESGAQLLSGKQALSFSRIRKTDSDFKRTSRQHLVLLGVLKKITTLDFFSLTSLAAQSLGKVQTDLQLSDITALLPLLMNADSLRLRSVHVPFDGTYSDETINGAMVLAVNTEKNARLIRDFLSAE